MDNATSSHLFRPNPRRDLYVLYMFSVVKNFLHGGCSLTFRPFNPASAFKAGFRFETALGAAPSGRDLAIRPHVLASGKSTWEAPIPVPQRAFPHGSSFPEA